LNGTFPRRVTQKSLKVRKYAHFDAPLTAEALQKFSVTPAEVSRHSFFPLLGYQKTTRKIDFSVFPPLIKNKEREIKYASHTDSAIISIYCQKLSIYYEDHLHRNGLDKIVLAYRGGIGYNVPFAKSLIDEIRKLETCRVLCLDVSKFFDNICHDIARKNICRILGEPWLSDDWFKVLSRVTKYEYVSCETLEAKLGKSQGPRICDINKFRRSVRPIIKRNPDNFGIPQGTPISGLLANISMLEFDIGMHEKVNSLGGSYRRYSDDIAIVLPDEEHENSLITFANDLLARHGLSFNHDKTCRTTFVPSEQGQRYSGDILQYLGFTYDGSKILIRPESVKNFYAKMKTNIRRYIKSARKKDIEINSLRKRVLIGRFTHWGDNKNFVQYAYRAARELEAPEIKRQLRNHVKIFNRHWAKILADCDL
jgi:RNA-directed DNA polymerase